MSLKIDRVQLEIVIQQDQARQKMIELEERMRSANRELQKTKKQFGETSEEYKQQANVLKQLQQEYDNLYEEIGLTNLSLRDLGKRQKDLNAILRQLNPNTELYKQYSEHIDVFHVKFLLEIFTVFRVKSIPIFWVSPALIIIL